MNKTETCRHIQKQLSSHQRVVVSRYADGEYLILIKNAPFVGSGRETSDISEHLLEALKTKGQLVCVNQLKPNNIMSKDIWYKAHHYLCRQGNHDLYGHANWNVEDYCGECNIVPIFFQQKTLIIAGHARIAQKVFLSFDTNFDWYETPSINAAQSIGTIINDVERLVLDKKYNNVILSCGKVGKILLARLITRCDANLIDFGAVLNAIIQPHIQEPVVSNWGMSWAKTDQINLKELSLRFFRNMKRG